MNERPHTDAYPIGSRAVESKSAAGDPTPTVAQRGRPPGVDVLPRPFGRYELRQLLGRGGMGAVYLAHDPQLDRLVALKVPTPVAVEGWRERFVAEARAAATLTHPNVCPVYDVGEVDGQPYLTMAYIEGETLAAKLARERFDLDEAAELVATVARAMQAAHSRASFTATSSPPT